MTQTTDDYERILRGELRLIDVRAPVEFAKGAPAGAVNLPILDDAERAAVGTAHRTDGGEVARDLGHQLVSGPLRERRIEGWIAEWAAETARDACGVAVCCWRGGDRSRIAQTWLAEAGCAVPRVEGGFRALRRAGIEVVERAAAERSWAVLGGRTGSGKTDLLLQLEAQIDLEGFANHRGSSFGQRPGGQPTQLRFELDLAARILKLPPAGVVVLEDESAMVGQRTVPAPLMQLIRTAPFVRLEIAFEERIANVHRDYVLEPLGRGCAAAEIAEELVAATDRLAKRLGPERHDLVRSEIKRAFSGSSIETVAPHNVWIGELLTRYYDPLYDKQILASGSREVFCGDMAQCLDYFRRG